jgi:citrate synthase
MTGFRHDAHPMGMLLATVGALSTFYPDGKQIHDPRSREIQTHRLIAKIPTIAAFAFRRLQGQPLMYPSNQKSYVGNFVEMMFSFPNQTYELKPPLVNALELLFILHADHEQNASTAAVRNVGSTEVDPYSAIAAGIGALYGPLHGGANEAVLRMLREVGNVKNVPQFIEHVKKGERKLMGFGHRVYKNYDPRARVIKKAAEDVFEVTGVNPLLEVALQLENIALEDDYFLERKLYPNVDFYSGLIYEAMGMPVEMFPVLFAIPRTAGWIAQWLEGTADPEQKIARPRQVYTGELDRTYVPMEQRSAADGRRAW